MGIFLQMSTGARVSDWDRMPYNLNPLRHCLCAEKKLWSWKNFGLSGPFFWQKLGTWVLPSAVFVPEKVPSGKSKNIRHKTSDLRSAPHTFFTYDK